MAKALRPATRLTTRSLRKRRESWAGPRRRTRRRRKRRKPDTPH